MHKLLRLYASLSLTSGTLRGHNLPAIPSSGTHNNRVVLYIHTKLNALHSHSHSSFPLKSHPCTNRVVYEMQLLLAICVRLALKRAKIDMRMRSCHGRLKAQADSERPMKLSGDRSIESSLIPDSWVQAPVPISLSKKLSLSLFCLSAVAHWSLGGSQIPNSEIPIPNLIWFLSDRHR